MKKRIAISLMCAMLISILAGCDNSENGDTLKGGDNSTQGSTVTSLGSNGENSDNAGQNSEPQSSDISPSNGVGEGQINKLGLLERDGDKDHFTPKTDDYIYQIVYSSDDGASQDVILYSFDEKGKLVQWDERRIDGYYLVNSEMDPYYADKGAVLVGDALYYSNMEMQEYLYGWSDKYGVLYDIAGQGSKYYASKALRSEQTELKNAYTESDFPEVAGAGIQMYSDDYVIERQNDGNFYEGYIYQAFLGYDGQTPLEVPVKSYDDFSYIHTEIHFYDDKGTEMEDYVVIYAFDEAEMIDSYFKHGWGSYFDTASADPSDQSVREADFSEDAKNAMQNTERFKISGKYLVTFCKESEPNQKPCRELDDDFYSIYYSKPYLSDSQIANDSRLP